MLQGSSFIPEISLTGPSKYIIGIWIQIGWTMQTYHGFGIWTLETFYQEQEWFYAN